MIDLTVTGCEQPAQSRVEIARLLNEYGVGAVCLLRNGGIVTVTRVYDLLDSKGKRRVNGVSVEKRADFHRLDGSSNNRDTDIIRVFPPGTRLLVTVEVE